MEKLCLNCGSSIKEGTQFCSNCGVAVSSDDISSEEKIKPQNQAVCMPQPIGASQSIGESQSIGAAQTFVSTEMEKKCTSNVEIEQSANSSSVSQHSLVQNSPVSLQSQALDDNSFKPKKKKSMALAMVLSFLFGPLGMLYTNVKHAVILIILAVIVSFITGGVVGLLFWIASMIWTYIDVKKINEGEC